MAVNGNLNFQRRNIGRLADIPTYEDVGQSAYVDYSAAAQNAPPAAMREAVSEADAAPTAPAAPSVVTPETLAAYDQAQQAFLAAQSAAAERQKRSAMNPINRIGSILGGVVGAPFALLENAIGGGDNDLTRPFEPKQNAQERYSAAVAGISKQKLGLEQQMAGLRGGLAQAMTAQLVDRGKLVDETHERLSILALNVENDPNPQMAFERGKNRLMANPLYAPVMQELGYDEQPWYKGLAAELAQGKDVQGRIDTRNKITTTTLPYQSTAIQTDQYGNIVNVVQQDGSTSAPVVSPQGPAAAPTELPSFTEDDWNNAGGTSGNAGGTFR